MSQFECICEDHSPLPELAIPPKSHEKERIGHFIAENLVQNGACLQVRETRRSERASVCVCMCVCVSNITC